MTERRPPHAATIRLHGPLTGARAINPAEALPPAVLAVAPSALLSSPPPEPPPAPVPEPREAEEARRAQEERELIERTLGAVSAAVRDELSRRDAEHAEWRKAAAELGVAIAARILHDRISADGFPVEAVVRELVGQAGAGPLTVHLHPQDLELLHRRLGGKPLIRLVGDETSPRPPGDAERITFHADESLGRGDCRVEAKETLVLSGLAEQLEEVRRQLLRSLGHASVGMRDEG
jgi:flagellar biosynthesis/type III secretory pathway protein FliH